MSHYIKNYQVLVSLKGGYGPQATGEPAEYAVLNYMEVDGYRQAEYEKMELETFMPIHKNQGQKAVGAYIKYSTTMVRISQSTISQRISMMI